tara:strand:+ start:1797 stop:2156 length:360 start_codon:yes stop_codon:yes gene_type:complete
MSLRLSQEELERSCEFIEKLGAELSKVEEQLYNLEEEKKVCFAECFIKLSQNKLTLEEKKQIATTDPEVQTLTPKIAKLIGLRVKYRNQLKLEDNKLNLWRTISANTRREQDFYNKLGD